MKSKLVKLRQLSGNKASIYSVWLDDLQMTSLESFLIENKILFLSEINDILNRLEIIGNVTGAREQYFKANEGKPGDGVCALRELSRRISKRLKDGEIRFTNDGMDFNGNLEFNDEDYE